MFINYGIYNSIGYIGQALGLQTTPASTCAFLCSLTVVVVPLFNILAGKNIYAHEETGNQWTYNRDIKVQKVNFNSLIIAA